MKQKGRAKSEKQQEQDGHYNPFTAGTVANPVRSLGQSPAGWGLDFPLQRPSQKDEGVMG